MLTHAVTPTATPSNRSPTHIPILFIGDKIQGRPPSARHFPSRLTPLKARRSPTGSLMTCVCTVYFSQGSKGRPAFFATDSSLLLCAVLYPRDKRRGRIYGLSRSCLVLALSIGSCITALTVRHNGTDTSTGCSITSAPKAVKGFVHQIFLCCICQRGLNIIAQRRIPCSFCLGPAFT
jgi:hypothetical protein